MARIIINYNGSPHLIESIESETNVYSLQAVKDPILIYDAISKNESKILVELFLQDSDHRPLSEVAKSLKTTSERVKMMRHQFRTMTDTNTIKGKRKTMLKNFYKL